MVKYYRLGLVASVLALGACALDSAAPGPDLSFSSVQAESVYVGSYEVVPVPGYATTDLPQGFAADPAKNIYDYFNRRYKAQGVQGALRVSITDVSVKHSVEQSESKMGAFLNVAKKDRYEMSSRMKVELQNPTNMQTVELRANRMISISEHASLAERETLQAEAVRDMIGDLDREVQKILSQQFQLIGQPL